MEPESQAHMRSTTVSGTVLGIFALLFWSSTVAFGRRLTEDLGVWTATSIAFIVAGLASCLFWSVRYRGLQKLYCQRPAYLWGSGGFFILYIVCLYGSIGLAGNRQQVLEVGILNYLWPALTLVLSVPILGNRPRWTLWPGLLFAVSGGVLVLAQQGALSWDTWQRNITAQPIPYVLALLGAFAWALYSNLSRRYGPPSGVGAQPLFVLGAGVILLLFRAFAREQPSWTPAACLMLAFTSVFTVTLAYAFWDYAMRTGKIVLLAALSYLIPVLSTALSAVLLGIKPGVVVWAACVLVVAGALVCRASVVEDRG